MPNADADTYVLRSRSLVFSGKFPKLDRRDMGDIPKKKRFGFNLGDFRDYSFSNDLVLINHYSVKILVKLVSAVGSGYAYYTKRKKTDSPLILRKYDPVGVCFCGCLYSV